MENITSDRKTILTQRKSEINLRSKQLESRNRTFIFLGLFLILISFIVKPMASYMDIMTSSIIPTFSILLLVYGCLILLFGFLRPRNLYQTDIQEIDNELDLLSIALTSEEERAEKLFKHHHLELKRYYDENLKQSSWLFIVGIGCIFAGFAIIGVTLYLLYEKFESEIENKILIASMGAIGAILTNFIAVIFLKMHAETVKSLTEFHNRFVNTHHFYFGNFLVAKVKDDLKREQALIDLALSINLNRHMKNEELENE